MEGPELSGRTGLTEETVLEALVARQHLRQTDVYLQDRTQAELGAELGVSQARVSRLLNRAMERPRQSPLVA